MKRVISLIAFVTLSLFANGQALPYVPRAMGAYISPSGTGAAGSWFALSGSGSVPIPYVPYAEAMYVSTDGTGNAGTWVPWTGASGAPTACVTSSGNYVCNNAINVITSSDATVTSSNALLQLNATVSRSDIAALAQFAPNLGNSGQFVQEIGQSKTNGNSFYMDYFWINNNNAGNALWFQARGGSPALTMFNNTHTVVGGNTDAGYNFDVIGAMRAQSYTGPAAAPTGACATNGQWVFSQDGHATFCAAGTWTTKI